MDLFGCVNVGDRVPVACVFSDAVSSKKCIRVVLCIGMRQNNLNETGCVCVRNEIGENIAAAENGAAVDCGYRDKRASSNNAFARRAANERNASTPSCAGRRNGVKRMKREREMMMLDRLSYQGVSASCLATAASVTRVVKQPPRRMP